MLDRVTVYLSRRYARAFFLLHGHYLDQQHADLLRTAAQELARHHGWKVFFLTSVTTRTDQRACCAVLLQHFKLPQSMLKILTLLLQHNRMQLLPVVLELAAQMIDERDNLERFTVEVSNEAVVEQVKALEPVLERKLGKRVRFIYQIQPSLIAGFSAQSKYHQCQYSVRRLLNCLVCRNCA